jgi:hypothetical protein
MSSLESLLGTLDSLRWALTAPGFRNFVVLFVGWVQTAEGAGHGGQVVELTAIEAAPQRKRERDLAGDARGGAAVFAKSLLTRSPMRARGRPSLCDHGQIELGPQDLVLPLLTTRAGELLEAISLPPSYSPTIRSIVSAPINQGHWPTVVMSGL